MDLVADTISYLHIVIIMFISISPFFGDEYLTSMHLLVVPFILLHWKLNNQVCALTEMEKICRGKKTDDETFFGQLVGPVYKFNDKEDETALLWILMIGLWILSFIKLWPSRFDYLRRVILTLSQTLRPQTGSNPGAA